MNKYEGLLVPHALQLAGAARPGSSRRPVILPGAAGGGGHPIVTASGDPCRSDGPGGIRVVVVAGENRARRE